MAEKPKIYPQEHQESAPNGNTTDGARRFSTGEATITGDADIPQVDTEYASTIQASRLHGKSLMWMVTFVAGTGFTLFGYDQGVMSALLTLPSFEAAFPQTAGGFQDSQSSVLQSLLVAIYELGCMVGALSNLYVGDALGRRYTIAIGGAIMIVGAALQAGSVDYAMMLVARVITGLGNGLLTSTVPAYQSECAKPHQRGQLVLFEGSLITFGIMIAYWLNVGFFFTQGSISWRFPIAFQIIFAIIMIFCIFVFRLPESPRWLVAKGKHAEALAVLAALEGTDVNNKEILRTFHGICNAAAEEEEGGFSFKMLLTNGKPQHLRRTLLGIGAQCFQQISGINLITYYLTSVLTQIGLDAKMSRIISGVNGTCYFLTSLVAILIIERLGRRPLMLWAAAAQAGTMAVLAGLYNLNLQGNKAAQGVSVLCLFLFNTWFSIGWLGMTWLYPAEVTPLRIRAPANALSTASNWIFNFTVVMAVGPMFNGIGLGTYALFAALNAVVIWPTVYMFFPETKKYSLEDLDIIFALAHETGQNPVNVSISGDIPPAGSREADKILGRSMRNLDMTKEHALEVSRSRSRRMSASGGGRLGRMVSRRSSQGVQQV